MKIQLSKVWSGENNRDWYSSPKYDGIRAVYQNGQLLSRSGKEFHGLQHIIQECEESGFDFLDGELLIGNDFNTNQSVIMSHEHEQKKDVKFIVFAVGGSYKDTEEMIGAMRSSNLNHISPYKLINDSEVEAEMQRQLKNGYEGIMLRDPKVYYKSGRTNALLKVKPYQENDYRITGIKEGVGKFKGMLGAIEVEINGKSVSIGTGFNDQQRKDLFNFAIIGRMAEIRYQEKTKAGSLRFPVFGKLKPKDT